MDKLTNKPMKLMSSVIDVLTRLDADKVYDIEIKEHKEKRSLDANAYFHVLVSKLAFVLHIDAETIKSRMVQEYTEGTAVRLPATTSIESFGIKYYKFIGEASGTKKPCLDYLIYKPTHELDISEMAALIEGTIQECQQVGIETMTPSEIANLKGIKNEY